MPDERRFDAGALIAGMFFVLVAVSHLVGGLSLLVVAPVVLVGIGLVALTLALTGRRR